MKELNFRLRLVLLLLLAVNSLWFKDALPQDNINETSDVKVGVVKNSNMVKVEVKGKAEVINLKDLFNLLGVNKLNRSYRTIASVEKVKITQGTKTLDGNAVVIVISGAEGILIIFVDYNNLENYMYTGMKHAIVKKGEKKNLYHSQEEGIQRPDIVTILKEGVAWVSEGVSDNYNLNYIPFIFPKLVKTSFEGSSNTEKFGIVYSEGNLSIVDGVKVLVSAKILDNYGETADNLTSLVKWSGETRTPEDLNFNIIEDSRNMAGKDIVLEFSSELLTSIFNIPSNQNGWESTEIVKPLRPIFRGGKSYIPYAVITREGIGIVEVPIDGGEIRVYKMGAKPFNVLEKSGTGYFKPLYTTDTFETLFGYVELSPTDKDAHYLSLYSPEYRMGIKVVLDKNVKRDYSIGTDKEKIILTESNNNTVLSIGIEKINFVVSVLNLEQ
jgi:hypothetical protein